MFYSNCWQQLILKKMVIKHEGQPFQLLKDRKPKNMRIVKLLLKDGTVKDAVVIDTGFGLEFRKDSDRFHCFDDDVKGWWYV